MKIGPRGEILSLLRAILRELRGMRQGQAPQKRLLSKRQASTLLGVSRTRTLNPLIASGGLRVVRVGGRLKIPLSEVERIAREGVPLPAFSKRIRRAGRIRQLSATELRESLRKMDF